MVRKARKRVKPLCAKDEYYESAIEQCRSCRIPCSLSKPSCKQFGCQGFTFPIETSPITSSKSLLTNTQESAPPGAVGLNIHNIMIVANTALVIGGVTLLAISIRIIHVIVICLIKKRGRIKDKHCRETDHNDSASSVDSTTPILRQSKKHQKSKGCDPLKGEDTAPSSKDVTKLSVKTEDASSQGQRDQELGAKADGIRSAPRFVTQLSVEAGQAGTESVDRYKHIISPTLNVVNETSDRNNTEGNPKSRDGISGQDAAELTELRADTAAAPLPDRGREIDLHPLDVTEAQGGHAVNGSGERHENTSSPASTDAMAG